MIDLALERRPVIDDLAFVTLTIAMIWSHFPAPGSRRQRYSVRREAGAVRRLPVGDEATATWREL